MNISTTEPIVIKREHWSLVNPPTNITAIIDCPGCDQPLGLQHKIASDGAATPSVKCTWAGCTFHDYVKLEGWIK